jgi:hypothetical protein
VHERKGVGERAHAPIDIATRRKTNANEEEDAQKKKKKKKKSIHTARFV